MEEMNNLYMGNLTHEGEQEIYRQVNISVFVTNLNAYNEGKLIGEWVKLPCSVENMKNVLERNHITTDSGWFISDVDLKKELLNIKEEIGMYANIDELNYFAVLLDKMNDADYEKFECIVSSGCDSWRTVTDYIKITENLDCYTIIPVNDYDELGQYLTENITLPDVNGIPLSYYIDYEAVGKDYVINAAGQFGTTGFVECISTLPDNDIEIPKEYMIMPQNNHDKSVPFQPARTRTYDEMDMER